MKTAEQYFNILGFHKVLNNDRSLIYARDTHKHIGYIVFYKEPQAYKTDMPINKDLHHIIDLQMEELNWFTNNTNNVIIKS